MNGNKILLDTNAFIYFFEGQSKITNLVVSTPEIYFVGYFGNRVTFRQSLDPK